LISGEIDYPILWHSHHKEHQKYYQHSFGDFEFFKRRLDMPSLLVVPGKGKKGKLKLLAETEIT